MFLFRININNDRLYYFIIRLISLSESSFLEVLKSCFQNYLSLLYKDKVTSILM